jgi:hypothetical protein
MQLSHLLILAGVLGANAHPSGHQHLHRSAHEARRENPKFLKGVHHKPIPKPESSVAAATVTPAAPAPSAAASSIPDTSKASSSSGSSGSSGKFIPFCKGNSGGSASKVKRVTDAQVMYVGELGMSGSCPWNSNIMIVPSDIADLYDYVQTYTNVASESYQVRCANKMGADSKLTGMFDVPGQNQLVFTLAPGESKTVVAQPNTQLACAFAPGSVPKTNFGQFAGNWVEADFANTSNGEWSGADCSSLVAQAYDMDVPGCQVCGHGTCSTIHPGGRGENAYTKGMEALDGIGLNLPAGKVRLEVKVGYS